MRNDPPINVSTSNHHEFDLITIKDYENLIYYKFFNETSVLILLFENFIEKHKQNNT